jgi:cysteinyl-tRNA synthetase
MVREVNAAADAGEVKQGDVAPLIAALDAFDEIFDVIRNGDNEKTRAAMEWARSAGKISPEQAAALNHSLTDEQVDALIAERNQAKRTRDFAKSDAIRKQLADSGIILEDTKDGVRWKRK